MTRLAQRVFHGTDGCISVYTNKTSNTRRTRYSYS